MGSVWSQILAVTVVGCCLMTPAPVRGEAFRIINQGAAAIGQGDAFAAQADDPSAIHYNPAGMTQLPGYQFMLGTNLFSTRTTFTPTAGPKVHSRMT
jgi:long-chain fatty acid transport protein